MKPKSQKIEEVERLRGWFAENPIIVACTFQGIKVEEDFQLRRKMRQAGVIYRVVPNRLAGLASEGQPCHEAVAKFKGMTALLFAKDDPVGLMKTLIEQAKSLPVFGFKAGVVEGQELDTAGLIELSKMPGKPETQAKLLYLLSAPGTNLVRQINAPAQHVVGVLTAPARDLVSVLKQAVDQGKFRA
ncbi:MAG: 50S ribosomal protein L10 [Acidobacteria bacterium]|nr:50S ribosomal protein L10 [Acidobacteriota bacterium]